MTVTLDIPDNIVREWAEIRKKEENPHADLTEIEGLEEQKEIIKRKIIESILDNAIQK